MKSLEFEKVSVADARKALEGPPNTADKATTVAHRGPDTNPVLLDATIAWMAALPYAVRPTELAGRYPRIANSIAELWPRVSRCEAYLDSMLVDERGERKNFPPQVAMEITAVRSYYGELHPRAQSTGDAVERGQ